MKQSEASNYLVIKSKRLRENLLDHNSYLEREAWAHIRDVDWGTRRMD